MSQNHRLDTAGPDADAEQLLDPIAIHFTSILLRISITFVVDTGTVHGALWLRTGPSDSLEVQRFVPATPSAAELASYGGRYRSPELGVTWPITVEHAVLTLGTTPSELMNISGRLEPAMEGTLAARVERCNLCAMRPGA